MILGISRRRWYFAAILAVIALGLSLRGYVARYAEADYDEDDYLGASRAIREEMDKGDWGAIPNVQINAEHPPLVKLMYAVALEGDELEQIRLVVPRGSRYPIPHTSLQQTRAQSVLWGMLTILTLSLMNPLAGLSLSIQGVHLHYSSMAYLDSLPTFLSGLMAALYTLSLTSEKYRKPLFWASAACFGAAVACKYPFAWSGVALIAHALFYRHFKLTWLIGWGMVAVGVWFCLNPYLWPNPLERLDYQVNYHEEYAGNQVKTHRYFQPLDELRDPNSHLPAVANNDLWLIISTVMQVAAFGGVILLLRNKSLYGWWLVLGMAFLMIWPTQWPQHKMIIVVPYSLASAVAFAWLWDQMWRWMRRSSS